LIDREQAFGKRNYCDKKPKNRLTPWALSVRYASSLGVLQKPSIAMFFKKTENQSSNIALKEVIDVTELPVGFWKSKRLSGFEG